MRAPAAAHELVPVVGAEGSETGRRSIPAWLLIAGVILSAALAVALYAVALIEWREFQMPGNMNIDLAFLSQGFYRTVHGYGVLNSSIRMEERTSILSHLSPSFFTLIPAYALWPSPLVLMLIGASAVAVFGVTAVAVGWRLFGSAALALIWFGIFALHPSIPWAIFDDGFREVYLAMGFLSLALLFYLEKRDLPFFAMLVLAMASKEDVPLLVPVWGLVAWRQGRGPRLAAALVALGLGYFLLANMVIMPVMYGTPVGHMVFLALGSHAGNTPGEMMEAVRTSPGSLLQLATNREHLRLWSALLGPLLFLPLAGWEYLLIPAYVYVEISVRSAVTIPFRHIFPALPFIFVAAMVGTARLRRCAGRLAAWIRPLARHAAPAESVTLAAFLCGMIGSTLSSTSWPTVLRENRPVAADEPVHARLMKTLEGIPPAASLAATLRLVAQASSRPTLYFLGPDGYFEQAIAAQPDYLAVDLADLDDRLLRRIPPLLCQGQYGVVYDDVIHESGTHGRLLLALGAPLSANARVYESLLPGAHQPCPTSSPQVITPPQFRRAAAIRVRDVPSAIASLDMIPEPVVSQPGHGFTQIIHLPDHRFDAGWYRLDLTGAWPWPWMAGSSRLTTRVFVGERAVGQVTAEGGQPLRYATPPFRIDRRGTLPVWVQADLSAPDDREESIVALRPASGDCALVADAPSLNPPRQVTVDALLYLDDIPRHPGAELELPILSKNEASGYYLRISGDARGRTWVDFSVAGAWSLGQAAVDGVPLHRWTEIAATYDGREARIFVDGAQVLQDSSRSPRHAGTIHGEGQPLVIGCRAAHSPGSAAFPGRIAWARVWNRALAPQEIHDAENTGILSESNARGLVGSWEFQSVDGDTIADLSGARNVVTNAAHLARAPVAELKRPLAAWRSRELNLLSRAAIVAVPSARVREQLPSDLRHDDLFPETRTLPADRRYSQVIHLPDHTFHSGRYQIDLVGAWPLPWTPAAYQVTARVLVGDRVVGEATADGKRPLRYTTPPFTVDRVQTQPVRVQVDMQIPEGRPALAWALRPARDGCAIAADAPTLNPGRVTVEALTYLDAIPSHPGTEVELPILSKNNAPGYYLRLSSDDRGSVWAEFSVAGKWALARVDAGKAAPHRWMAIAATYDGEEAKIYINGDQAPQAPGRDPRFAGPINSQGPPLAIGCRDPKQSYEVVFPGLIAAARVWNRALSPAEIRDGETTWVVPSTDVSGLVGNWNLSFGEEKGEDATVPDLSPAGNPVVNGAQLARAPIPPAAHPFSRWYSRAVTVLERVVVRSAAP